MLTGNNKKIVIFARARAALTITPISFHRYLKSINITKLNTSTSYLYSYSPLILLSKWTQGLLKYNESNQINKRIVIISHSFAIQYESITREAKKLGFNALQRGEVRRRAKLFHFNNNNNNNNNNIIIIIMGEVARLLIDTRYASVMIPLRKLESLRAEKRNNIFQHSKLSKDLKEKKKKKKRD